MWYIVLRKNNHGDVGIFQNEHIAAKYGKISNRRKSKRVKFKRLEDAVAYANKRNLTYFLNETPVTHKKRKKRTSGQGHKHIDYKRYLQSTKWQAVRARCLERDEYTCQSCGAKTRLQVHHLTYARVGHEDLDDLITLCRDCHKKIHGIVDDEAPNNNQEQTS